MCGCVSAEKTQRGKKKEKRDSYDLDKDFLFPKLSLSLSLALALQPYYTHAPRTNFSRLQRAERALHCIALQNQDDRPASFILSLRMID